MTRDEQMQQSLDRAHARLLDMIEQPEEINLADCDLSGPEDNDLWDTLDTCCEPCPNCHHSSCDHMTSGCEWTSVGLICPCKYSMRRAKDAYNAYEDDDG